MASKLAAAAANKQQLDQQSFSSFDRTYRSSKCNEEEGGKNSESMIMECSDQSMLKLQFGKCSSLSSMKILKICPKNNMFFCNYCFLLAFIINCIAHWTEGSTNYLIGRVESSGKTDSKSVYKCITYSEISKSSQQSSSGVPNAHHHHDQFRQVRHKTSGDFESRDNIEIFEKSVLQILVSPDEFCRSVDTILDEQFSFTFNKVFGSRYHIAPPPTVLKGHHSSASAVDKLSKRDEKQQLVNGSRMSEINRKYVITHANCKFPKWLNRKWFNFKQTKSFQLDYRLDSLVVTDEKSAVVINKYTCTHMKSKKTNHVQAIVKSLNGW